MGHVINPLSFRLYNIRYWNNNWFLHNKYNFSYIFIQDILLFNFIKKILIKYLNAIKLGVIFINLKTIRYFNNINLYLYIHDSFLDLYFYNLKRNRGLYKLKKKLFYKFKKKYSFWFDSIIQAKQLKRKLHKQRVLNKFLIRKKNRLMRNFLRIFVKYKFLNKFWYALKNIFLWYLKKFNKNYTFNYQLYILALTKNNVNSNIVAEYFYIRLKQYYTIFEIVRSINFFLKKLLYRKKIIKGYKITFSGRFSRKQRATYSWKTFGSLRPSTVKSRLDYCSSTIALKYSNCAIKIWICLNKKKKRLVDFVI